VGYQQTLALELLAEDDWIHVALIFLIGPD
jgi:hypothetical protein